MLNLRNYLANPDLFALALLWLMPLASSEEVDRMARCWGVRNIEDRLKGARARGLVFHVSAGYLGRRKRRHALTLQGVEEVCAQCGTQPIWQVTEAGLWRLLERLDMVETVYGSLPDLFKNAGLGLKGERMDIFIDAHGVQQEIREDMRPTGCYWFPDGRVTALLIYEGWLQVPICRVGVLNNHEVLHTSHGGVYFGMNTEPEPRVPRRVNVSPATTVFVVDDAIGARSVLNDLANDIAKMVVDRSGNRFHDMVIRQQFGRVRLPDENVEVGVPEHLADSVADYPPLQERTGRQAVRILEGLTRLLVADDDSLVKWCGNRDGTYLRRALQGWIVYGAVEKRNGWNVFTPAGMGLISRRNGVPETAIRNLYGELGVGDDRTDREKLDRAGTVSTILANMHNSTPTTTAALSWSYRLAELPEGGTISRPPAPDAWLLGPDENETLTPLIRVEGDDPHQICKTLLPWLKCAEISGQLRVRVVAKTRRIEQACWRNQGHLEMWTTTLAEILIGSPVGPQPLWRQPAEQPDHGLWGLVLRPEITGRLSFDPFGLLRV